MKELPYFKFNASEWISGEITLEDLATQGAFINICSYYWFKSGCLTLTEIKRRLKLKQTTIDALVTGNHIKVTDDLVEISFLRQQFDERGHISKRNSLNGSKGGAPNGNKNAEKNNRKQPKTSNIEEEKEEEIENIGNNTSERFIIITPKYAGQKKYRIYGPDGIIKYLEMCGSKLSKPEFIDKFLREKDGHPFNDFGHLLSSYNLFIEKQYA